MASGVISHPPHYERCSMQFPQSCTNVVRSEYKNDMKYMTQINVFKFSHSIIYLPFIYFLTILIFAWFRLSSVLKMGEMIFFETLMTPNQLHILNPRDSINHNQVHDMSQCLASSFVKGIGLSIYFLVDVGSYFQLECIPTPT